MKKIGLSLFLVLCVSLVCSLTVGNVLANKQGMPPCCFNEQEVESEILPVIELIPVTEIVIKQGMPPCCFNEPEMEPEILPVIESIPVTEMANKQGMPPCCFNEPVTNPI